MAIDKAKGIICKPMPKAWHDKHTVNRIEDEETRNFYRSIIADKKPYFMRYIYPDLMKQYNTYIKNTNRNALREFQMTVDEMMALPFSELTERQAEFLKYYKLRMPVGISDCVMNKICRRFEQEFDGHIGKHNSSTDFDYNIMKYNALYSTKQYADIKQLYNDYNNRLVSYSIFSKIERVDEIDAGAELEYMNDEFRRECYKVCPNEEALCDIILDICYTRNSTKRFAWNMVGTEIINNLLKLNNRLISYPILNQSGDIEYCGKRFSIETTRIGDTED